MRNAIEQTDSSRTPDGLTFSRAPTRLYQYTPTFSLLWVGMVHDYWRYVNDPDFVRTMMPGVRAVLNWFARLQEKDGRLRSLPYYNFLDSGVKWNARALAPYETQLLIAYQWAQELESHLGDETQANADRLECQRLSAGLRARYWTPTRHLFADDAAHTLFSQHMNALAVLAGIVPAGEVRPLMERTLSDPSLTQCTIYFRYYLHAALVKAGRGDRYLDMLAPWRKLLSLGVTTWPESEADDSRSDCHGWGDHPNIEIYRTVLGIDSAAPGFARVRIEPHLGTLHHASGAIPHPKGTVNLQLRRIGDNRVEMEIDTPVPGKFIWQGRERRLRVGASHFVF